MPDWTIWALLFVLIAVYFLLRRTTPSRRKHRGFDLPQSQRGSNASSGSKREPSPSTDEKKKPIASAGDSPAEEKEEHTGSALDDLESELEGFLDGETKEETDAPATRGGTTSGGTPPSPPREKVGDKVTFGVFTSEGIEAGNSFIVDVWAYLMQDFNTVTQMAKMMDRDAAVGMKAGVNISRGTILSLQMQISGMAIDDPVQTMVWDGDPINCSFIVQSPPDLPSSRYTGKVTVSSYGVPFASISFAVQVIGSQNEEPVKVSSEPAFPKSAFASYASKNRDEVLGRIHGMLQVNPDMDVFLDAMTLRSGQNWADQLVSNILSRETFYLFWSPEAAASEWVEQEWKLALEKKGIQFINPVPLVDPRDAPPPAELGSLHFNDAHVAMIQYERMRKQLKN